MSDEYYEVVSLSNCRDHILRRTLSDEKSGAADAFQCNAVPSANHQNRAVFLVLGFYEIIRFHFTNVQNANFSLGTNEMKNWAL